MHPLVWLLTYIGGNWIINQIYNGMENNYVAEQARKYARMRGKPVLDFGCGASPRGDYNVDIVPRPAKNFILIQSFDKPKLPFPDKFFGAALCLHVLEHTNNPEHTLKELERVAERVYVVTPNPLFWRTWLHLDHKWIFLTREVYFPNPFYHTAKDLEDFPLLYPEMVKK
jgi:SAM-dependent methyltransferase